MGSSLRFVGTCTGCARPGLGDSRLIVQGRSRSWRCAGLHLSRLKPRGLQARVFGLGSGYVMVAWDGKLDLRLFFCPDRDSALEHQSSEVFEAAVGLEWNAEEMLMRKAGERGWPQGRAVVDSAENL